MSTVAQLIRHLQQYPPSAYVSPPTVFEGETFGGPVQPLFTWYGDSIPAAGDRVRKYDGDGLYPHVGTVLSASARPSAHVQRTLVLVQWTSDIHDRSWEWVSVLGKVAE